MNLFYHWTTRAIPVVLVCLLFYSIPVRGQSTGNISNKTEGTQNQAKDPSRIIESLLLEDVTWGPYAYPPVWDSAINTGTITGIIVNLSANPNINGYELKMGDYIGGFYTGDDGELHCGGADYWQDTANIIFPVFGDDPATPEKDGFSYGEIITYKVFSWEFQSSFDVDEIQLSTNYYTINKWYPLSVIELIKMNCFEDLLIKAGASPDSLCNQGLVSLSAEIYTGTGNITYDWSSDPTGFTSTLQNPEANVNETTTFFVEAFDGINTANSMYTVFVPKDPIVSAGPDIDTCGAPAVVLFGTAENHSSVMWQSSGDGYFSSPGSINTTYYIGNNDLTNGSVTLTIVAQPIDPCTIIASDDMLLTLYPAPAVSLDPTTYGCENLTVLLEALGENYNEVEWTTEGNGYFSNANSLSTEYTPGSYGNSHGSVDLTVTVSGISPCNIYSSATTTLMINEPAFTYAGPDATICKNEVFPTSASAAYYGTVQWMTNGDGYFENPAALNTIYHPGDGDKTNGYVRLTILVNSIAPCTGSDYDRMYLYLNDDPVILLGEDMTICGNETAQLSATAENYSAINWQTSGDGSFVNISGTSAGYQPGPGDVSNGSVDISVFAEPLAPCTQSAGDNISVSFLPTPQVNAGSNKTICSSNFAYLTGSASDYTALEWTTSGDGYFQNPTNLITKYFPGTNDISAGQAVLTLTAAGEPPCNAGQSDDLLVTIQPVATVNAGVDQNLCEGTLVQLDALATHYSSIVWSTDGDGTFNNKYICSPVYTPGPGDISGGGAILSIQVNSISPCSGSLNDQIAVSITKQVTVSAGSDASLCENETFMTSGQANNFSIVMWETSGDGSFTNATNLSTEYTPGPNDLSNGQTTLSLTAEPMNPCTVSASDQISLHFIAEPTVHAGADIQICEGNSAPLSGTAGNQASVHWTTSGDGFFPSPYSLNTNYYPGTEDKSAGSVLVTLTALPVSPCTVATEDVLNINIEPLPEVSAGDDITICEGENIQLNGTAQNFSSTGWSTDGTGSFADPGSPVTQYTPSAQDIQSGIVSLCLTANSLGLCNAETDCLNVTIVRTPFAYAGDDTSIPYGSSYLLADASADHYSSILWSTSDGTGTFDDVTQVNASYTPSEDDLNIQFINLMLTAEPLNPCQTAAQENIQLEVTLTCENALANAGIDATVCAGASHAISGATANHYETLQWTTSGDGTFSANDVLNPVYTPGADDIQAGMAELCLTAHAYSICTDATDCLTLYIEQAPTADAGIDQTICETENISLNATASNFGQITWSSTGDGTFADASSLITSYTPGTQDIAYGNVELCLTVTGSNACTEAQDCITVTFRQLPQSDAGADLTICETSVVELAGFAQHYSALQWATSGDGSFTDAEILNPVYTPGPEDLTNGTAELCLTALGQAGCENISDCLIVTFQHVPVVSAGNDILICEGENALLLGTAQNHTSVEWTTLGDGNFENPAILNTNYTPGLNDILNGTVEICLTATGSANCANVSDCMSIEIQPLPEIEAGNNLTICEGSAVNLSANANNYSEIEWTTGGDGTFAQTAAPSTQYIPGPEDINNGVVQLCITATGNSGCGSAEDCITVFIDQQPTAYAGEDANICAGDVLILSGTATDYDFVNWSSSGDGTFNDAGALNTTYTPGPTDITNGFVDIEFFAITQGECSNASDVLAATIQKLPMAEAGDDATIGQGLCYHCNTADAENYNDLMWNSTGTGNFTDPGILLTEYNPSQADYSVGSVTLELTAMAVNPCTIADSDQMTLTFEITGCLDASANAGTDATVCENESFQTSAMAANYASLLWETDGDGNFDDPTLLNPTYTPGPIDLQNGNVTLCLTAFAEEDCLDATDCLSLTFQELPVSHAGSDNTIPKYEVYQITDAYAVNHDLIQWVTTNGTGSFSNETVMNPTYQPGPSDWLQGWVELGMFASPVSPCEVSADDLMIISFIDGCQDAVVDAGADINACEGELEIQLNATAGYFTSLTWTTSGDGSFDHPNTLNPNYVLGPGDISTGTVILTLTATAYDPCNGTSDQVTITLHPDPVASAGEDLTVCGSSGVSIIGSVQNQASFTWTTTGDGTFLNSEILNPTYLPGTQDMASGFAEICLEAEGFGQCQPSVDCMTLTLQNEPTADAGENASICESELLGLNGTATNYSFIEWTSTGDGAFGNAANLQTTYMPGPDDLANGSFEICLTAYAAGMCPETTDCITVQLLPLPEVVAVADLSICETGSANLAATAEKYNEIIWTTSGDGAFDDPASLTPVYTPGQQDILNQTINLTVTAVSLYGCDPATDVVTLSIEPAPAASAGQDATICEGNAYSATATASNYASLLWETSGDGSFDNAGTLNPVYTPGPSDLLNGSVELCLTASAVSLCDVAVSCLTLNIQPQPSAYAGEDATVIIGDNRYLGSATAQHYSSVMWTTSGTGNFEDATIVNTSYLPGADDYSAGSVMLTLTASAVDPCQLAAEDDIILTFVEGCDDAIADAGEDFHACLPGDVILTGTGQNFTTILWETMGDGSFGDPTSLQTIYIPGPNDLTTGSAELCLTAFADGDCMDSTDCVTVYFENTPQAYAGEDITTCETQPEATLSATAENYSSFSWNTSGDGYFTGSSTLTPVYHAGMADLFSGSVTITLTANSDFCGQVSDEMNITIEHLPTVYAGENTSICEGEDFTITEAFASGYESIEWTTSGDGTFDDPQLLYPVYTPGLSDIANGGVELCLIAHASSPCPDGEDCFTLSIMPVATVDAGSNLTICEDQPAQLNATATNYSTLFWETSGDGNFNDPTIPNPVYTPGTQDIANKLVSLSVTATSINNCNDATDQLNVKIDLIPQAMAGDDQNICSNETVQLSGSAVNHTSVLWTTSGDGDFSNPESLTTTYTPGANDLTNGTAELCLTANSNAVCDAQNDCLVVTFNPAPVVLVGEDQVICESETVNLSATAENYASLLWSTSGDGSFGDPTVLNTVYTPGPGDVAAQITELTLTATGLDGCGNISEILQVSIIPGPTANAGNDRTICETSVAQLTTATADNYTSLLWSTSGDGTFDDATILNPVYTPGSNDIATGSVEVCLTAVANSPCNDYTDCITIMIQPAPTVNAGEDLTICETSSFFVLSGQASYYSASNWYSNGDGTLDNSSLLETTYYPGPNDLNNGFVEICLIANGLTGCTYVEDCMVVTFQVPPTANAGADATVCEDEGLQLNGIAENASTALWTTSGDGMFTDNSLTATTYTPGTQDILDGGVELCLTAVGIAGCEDETDCLFLSIQQSPFAFAGEDINICEGSSLQLAGSAEHYSSLTWSTMGDGSFDDPSSPEAVYTPGPEDIAAGNAELCLEAAGLNNCGNASDCLVLNIVKNPTAYAGEDITLEQGYPFVAVAAVAENYQEIIWSSSGTGTFNDPALLNVQYTPSQGDYAAGAVTLTLQALPVNPCTLTAQDEIYIEFLITGCLDASASAGDDAAMCTTDNGFQLNASAANYESLLWTTEGDGTFSDASVLNPVYNPGTADIDAGFATLCLTAYAYDTCQDATDCMTLTLQKPPFAFAGTDNTIPKFEVYTLSDAYATDYDLVQWVTTNGTGSFSNETVVNPTYQPGISDWLQGYVELSMFTSSLSPCEVASDDMVIISFVDECQDAFADAGADIDLCEWETSVQPEASAGYFAELNWTTSGDGTFDFPQTLNPVYTLGTGDIALGTVELTLEAVAYDPCLSASDAVVITLHGQPTANAGSDMTICGSNGFEVNGQATNYSEITWTTSGDGVFMDNTSLNPLYLPGPADMTLGEVELCLEAEGFGQCIPVSDCMTATLVTPPTVDAGEDILICEDASAHLNATASDYVSLLWQTSGDGIFDDASLLDPVYTPGSQDIENGNAELCLTAIAQDGCVDMTSCLTLTIQQNPIADAGIDATIEEDQTYTLSTATATNAAGVNWSTTGLGSFDDNTLLSATYFPAPEDITSGSVELALTASPMDPCTVSADDFMILTIIETCDDAVADAGADFTSCLPGHVALNATAENYVAIAWSTNGDGSYTDPQSLTSEYIPGPQDIAAMQVELCLTAIAEEPCIDDTDCVTVTFVNGATANAGADIETCDTQSFVTLSGTATNHSSVYWSTTGTGNFVPATGLNPKYFMSYYDKLIGEVQLILTAVNDVCGETRDTLTLTINHPPVAYAGEDAIICDSETYMGFEAFVDHAENIAWATNGDGYFDNPQDLQPVYHPGIQDLAAGSVEICLTAFAQAPCNDVTDCLTITLLPSATVDAGNDINICEGETLLLNASAANFATLQWTTNGDGVFDDATILNPIYTPGVDDILNGTAKLTLSATSANGCSDASDDLILNIDRQPTAYAGEDISVCEGENIVLTAIAENFAGLQWTTSGDGSFGDPGAAETTYLPGPDDIASGTTEICVTAISTGSCNDATDCFTLTLYPAPYADAGTDLTICESAPVQLNGTSQNYTGLVWTTSGDGSFDDPSILNPVYTPGPEDIQNLSVSLTLTAASGTACPDATDDLLISIAGSPVAVAGNDTTLCEAEQLQLNGWAENYTSILWSSNGTGAFSDASALQSAYLPSPQDVSNGSVEICLTAFGNDYCEDFTDCFLLTLYPLPYVETGDDLIICETGVAQLSAYGENYNDLQWSTTGDGEFDDPAILNPVYTPGPQDILNQSVTLNITASGFNGCPGSTDEILLSIVGSPTAWAGDDITLCSNETLTLDGVAVNAFGTLWTTNGDGTFDNENILQAVYTPGEQDMINGMVEICLTAFGDGICSDHTDCFSVSITPAPVVDAGDDISICENELVPINATASNAAALLWETSGDGNFDNPAIASPVYTPGPQDIENGEVILTLTATGLEECNDASDDLILNIERSPQVNAGDDQTICTNETLQLSAAAGYFSSIGWTTSGDGSFDDPTSLTAIYTPGTGDLAAGEFEVCLTAFAENLCTDATDCLQVSLQEGPLADAGDNATICEDEAYQLNGTATSYAFVSWTTSGDGSFGDPEALSTLYVPGPEDLLHGEAILCLTATGLNDCGVAEDCLTLTFQPEPSVDAGDDMTICENHTAILSATVSNAGSMLWETQGDGSFDNPALANAVYTPGAQDLLNGSVELCLTAEGVAGCDAVTDCMSVSIQPLPGAFAGNDMVVCETETVTLQGEAFNYLNTKWNTSGDGSFVNTGSLITSYVPGPDDLAAGSVELCLTAFGLADCEDATDCLVVEFQSLPTVNAGEDATICETATIDLQGTATEYADVAWITSGDGSFGDAGSLVTSYTPGPADINAGQVEICLTATGLNGCNPQEDCLTLFINPLPQAFAGADKTICEGSNVNLSGSALQYNEVIWTTTGDGTFTSANTLQTTYIPGPEDKASGGAELCITATGNGICEDAVDCMQLTIQPGPVAFAGEDRTICETEDVQLNGSAQNHLSVFWTTSGTGGFSNPQSLNPLYMPSNADIQNGSVQLCMKANGLNGCGNVTDCLTVTIYQLPDVFAGDNVTICENEILDLTGTAEYYASIEWTTTGDGTFGDPASLNTNYTPGPNDLLTQQAQICLTATGMGNCDEVSECFTLDIQSAPTVSVGDDHAVCQSGVIPLNATATDYQELLWTSNGDGYFSDPSLLNTEYIPGPQDIENGLTEVCLTVYGLNGCGEVTECILITYVPEPSAFAGADATILQGETFITSNAQAAYFSTVEWQTSGSGSFTNADNLIATYHPSNADIAAGEVVLTLIANPNDPCTVAATDELNLTIFITGCLDAEANAGEDQSICTDESLYLEQATAYFYETIKWYTSGDGTFDDDTRLDATYTPGPEDLAQGNVTLCLKAFAEGLCLDDTDCLELLFQPAPVAFAGSDNTIPMYQPYNLGEAFAENYELIQWFTTNGTGSFSDENAVNPVYQAGPSDWLQGYVELGMVASPIDPCTYSAEDVMILSFIDECTDAIVDAGADTLLICDFDSTIDVSATAAYYSGISWTTAGDGTFGHPNSLVTQYTLGPNDKLTGEVMLYVTAVGFSPCSSATDSILVAPQYIPEVFAGNDLTVCEGDQALLDEAEAQFYSSLIWTTAGDGTFTDPENLVTEYEPGTQDIESGMVELTLTVESYPPCQIMVSGSLTINIDKLPVIVQDIEDKQVPLWSMVQFFVAAVDGKNYQWYGPDGLIPGADDPVFVIASADFDDIGNYHCVVYNDCGSTTSSTATLTVYEHQIVEIPAGWSGLSSWIDPYNKSVANMFSEVEDDLILVSNFRGIYYPEIGLNTLLLWDAQEGYQTKFRNPVEFEIKGLTNTNKNVEITAGWNYLPVISECPVSIADVFGGNPHVQIIKEIAGNGVYWPINGINTIGELIPGKAYFLRSAQPFTATFPECEGAKGSYIANPPEPENQTSWNNLHRTPATHVIVLNESLLNELNAGDVIGAFTPEGLCAGMCVIDPAGTVLTLYGDDQLTEARDGFTEGDPIIFRVFDVQTGTEYPLSAAFDMSYPQHDGTFVIHGMSGILSDGATSIYEQGEQGSVNIYPNPTSGVINISGLVSYSRIEFYSADGQILHQSEYRPDQHGIGPYRLDLGDLPTGVLYMRITNDSGIGIKKIIMK